MYKNPKIHQKQQLQKYKNTELQQNIARGTTDPGY